LLLLPTIQFDIRSKHSPCLVHAKIVRRFERFLERLSEFSHFMQMRGFDSE
jgi:hypothetical protein